MDLGRPRLNKVEGVKHSCVRIEDWPWVWNIISSLTPRSVFKPFIFVKDIKQLKMTCSPCFGQDDPVKMKPRFQSKPDRKHPLFLKHEVVVAIIETNKVIRLLIQALFIFYISTVFHWGYCWISEETVGWPECVIRFRGTIFLFQSLFYSVYFPIDLNGEMLIGQNESHDYLEDNGNGTKLSISETKLLNWWSASVPMPECKILWAALVG